MPSSVVMSQLVAVSKVVINPRHCYSGVGKVIWVGHFFQVFAMKNEPISAADSGQCTRDV